MKRALYKLRHIVAVKPVRPGAQLLADSKPGWIRGCFIILVISVFIYIMSFTFLKTPSASVSVFNIPEKFVYDLKWTGIKAGTASLELTSEGDKIKITSTAQSAPWVSIFYTVDDRVESTLAKNPSPIFMWKPEKYRIKVREGKHRRDKEVIFDHEKNKAFYRDYLNNEKKDFNMPVSVFDPISSFYYLRTLKLDVGKSAYVTIFDSKKVWDVEVQVLRRERVSLPIGTFNTIVVKPLMKSEGIFYRKGEIFIWLTDDSKHIPVKVETKVLVGYISATMVQGNY
jgi:Protein of unknown function (DUF3108)